MKADIMTVRKGDIVRFKSYALRVEMEFDKDFGILVNRDN